MSNITISIVSHGHDDLISSLLSQLIEYNKNIAKVIITHNIPSKIDYSFTFPFEIVYLANKEPLGFGENHNQAFELCNTEYFCIMNPDIKLKNDPFDALIACGENKDIAIIAPLIENVSGEVEDSARYFPTPFGLFKKIFRLYDGVYPDDVNKKIIYPEWVGGMFMLIKYDKYKVVSGFDESYFLYYEDVDFCLRVWRSGNRVALCKSAVVIHDARRTSHRELKFLKWHVTSAFRFFTKHLGRFPKINLDFDKCKKLLFFVTEDWYFYSHRLPLALAAKESGYDVAVVTHINNHGDKIRKLGFKLISLELSRRGTNPLKELNIIRQLISIYKAEKPDLVHQVALKPVLYGSSAAFFAKVPNIINALPGLGILFSSEYYKARWMRPLIINLFRLLVNRKNSRMILQNPDDVNLISSRKAVSPERISLIRGSGVDMNKYSMHKEEPGKLIVVLASRLLWDKGIGEFVRAAELIKMENDNVRFVLLGRSDEHNPSAISEQQLKKWHNTGVIEWWGYRSDMEEVFAQSHIVCLPSTYGEGVPKVLIEAASCGKPIVTTDAPGCREIVKDGVNGILVPVRDSNAVAQAIIKLMKSPELRQQMGKNGRELVEKEFSVEIVNRETLNLYESMFK